MACGPLSADNPDLPLRTPGGAVSGKRRTGNGNGGGFSPLSALAEDGPDDGQDEVTSADSPWTGEALLQATARPPQVPAAAVAHVERAKARSSPSDDPLS